MRATNSVIGVTVQFDQGRFGTMCATGTAFEVGPGASAFKTI